MHVYLGTRRSLAASMLLAFALPALAVDTDNDGLTDDDETVVHGTNYLSWDSDGDDIGDGYEVANSLNALVNDANLDADGDDYSNLFEFRSDTQSDDAASVPPLDDNYVEDFASFTGGQLPSGWHIPGSALTQGVELKPVLADSAWYPYAYPPLTGGAALRWSEGQRVDKIGYIELQLNVPDSALLIDTLAPTCGYSLWLDGTRIFGNFFDPVFYPRGNFAYAQRLYLPAGPHTLRFGLPLNQLFPPLPGFTVCDVAIDTITLTLDTHADADGDGLTDLEESARGTNPADPDTDDDGLNDYDETKVYDTDPKDADSDNDTLNDRDEVLVHGTNPNLKDTDVDQVNDNVEVANGLDPLDPTDIVSLTDWDGDRYPNTIEALYGSSAGNAASKPPIPIYADGQQESFEAPFDTIPWKLGTGSSAWVVTNAQAIDGSSSLRSTSPSATAAVFTVNTRQGTHLHFRVRSGGGGNSSVQVLINGSNTRPLYISGAGAWQFASVLDLPAGANQIEFRYTGFAPTELGCDCIYIDDIRFYHYPDYDQDGMSNAWETENGLNDNNAADAGLDTDNDGLTGMAEYRAGTSPVTWDSDGDTLADGADAGAGLNPLQNDLEVDSDGDGISNATEVRNATDPHSAASKPEQLGTYFESFEAASPPFWFSPGRTGPEDLDWAWTPLTATDGQASIVGTTGPLQVNRSPNVSMLVTVDDSFLSFDYSALNNAAYPGCGASDCTVNAQFNVIVDDEARYVVNPAGTIDWTPVGGMFLPAGEHLIEFGLTSPACVGTSCSNALPDDVAQTWIDSLLIKPAVPEDETDSDGDGVSDYDEVYHYSTDPMFPDIVCEDPDNPPDGKLFNDDCDDGGCHP